MMTYLISLLAIVALCAFWALFQQWLSEVDPDAKKRALKCGGCGRRGDCDAETSGR